MNSKTASSAPSVRNFFSDPLVIAIVVCAPIFIGVMSWAKYGPYYNAHPIVDGQVYGQLVKLRQPSALESGREALVILGNSGSTGRGALTFDVTIPESMVSQAEDYLANSTPVMIRYSSPSYYWRSESISGYFATSIEPAK